MAEQAGPAEWCTIRLPLTFGYKKIGSNHSELWTIRHRCFRCCNAGHQWHIPKCKIAIAVGLAYNILEAEDFAVILARWSGDDSITDAAIGKAAADLAGKVGGKSVAKMLAKTMAEKAGLLVGKKMAGKLGAKLGANFGAKLGSKAAAGFIPFLGAAVGGGINLWFISSVAASAEEWYRIKASSGHR